MPEKHRISVIILNYKTAELTGNCVRSLHNQMDFEQDEIIIVDNNSGQLEIDNLKKVLFETGDLEFVKLLELKSNDGFSAGNNEGIKLCDSKYYLLTNSDTEFLPGAVSELLKAAENYTGAGIISPKLIWPDKTAQVSCFNYHTPYSEIIRSAGTGMVTSILRKYKIPIDPIDEISRPEWTSFACVLIKENVIKNVGLLDDNYFMYFEDVDYCRRTRDYGYDIINWPVAEVIHFQGKSSDVKDRTTNKMKLPDFYYNSRARYYIKFYSKAGFLFSNFCWLLGRLISVIRELITKKAITVPENEFFNIWLVKK